MKNFYRTLSLVVLSAPAFAAMTPYHPIAKPLNERAYEINVTAGHFMQSGMYDYDGNEVEQLEGNSFSQTDIFLHGRYAYGRSLEFFLGMSFRQNSSVDALTEEELTTSGVESLRGGFRYSFDPIKKWRYTLEVSYAKTAYSNEFYYPGDTVPSEIVLGDDGQTVEGLLHLTYSPSLSAHYSASVGLRLPPEHLSTEIPWRVEGGWIFDRWALYAGVEGIYSMGNDEFSDNPAQKPRLPTGVTQLYNSVNREKVEPYAGIARAFDRWRLNLQYSQVMAGVSTDKGQRIMLGLTWSSSGVSAADKRLNTFKEYDLEATVTKVSPRGTFVRIDKGLTSDIEKGMRFDIFKTDYEGGNILFASGMVYDVGAEWAIVRLTQLYQSDKIQDGFTARGYRH